MLISVGERISCALVAMAIADLGLDAISLTGSQAGIVTDTVHGKAKIVEVRAHRIHEALDSDRIVLVAGFQGVSTDFDITTLGRGGSDTTAVALAAALGADACEIYTDVDGVFTADPRLVPGARKLHAVSYEEMLEMAASGAKVLALRSVEFARNHGVKLHVRSTFTGDEGTWITEEDERMLEKAMISGVTHTLEEAVYRVSGTDRADLFAALADASVSVDTIIQTGDGHRLLRADRGSRRDRGRTRPARRELGGARRPREGERDRRWHEEPSRGSPRGRSRRCASSEWSLSSWPPRRSRSPSTSPREMSSARSSRCTRPSSSPPPRRSGLMTRVGVVGATGAVGIRHPRAPRRARLRERAGPSPPPARPASRCPTATASSSSRRRPPEMLGAGDLDLCFFSVGTDASRELVPHAVAGGTVCIDKSDAFRLTDGVPLVVAGVNDAALRQDDEVVANPNCSAIQLSCVLKPLHDAAGLASVRLATYQSMSGIGDAGIERLRATEPAEGDLAMDWDLEGDEFSEESKLRAETRKILDLPDLPLQAQCVRVPVLVGHAQAIWVETVEPLSADEARDVLGSAPHVALQELATPKDAAGRDEVLVGRIRPDTANGSGLALWSVNDNLRKGAALNAVQIAEALLERRLVRA